jgi:hypothetical protein
MTTGPDGRALDVELGPEEWLAAVESHFNGQPHERPRRATPLAPATDSLAWIEGGGTAVGRPRTTGADRHPVIVVWKHGQWLVKAIVARMARLGQLTSPGGAPCDMRELACYTGPGAPPA